MFNKAYLTTWMGACGLLLGAACAHDGQQTAEVAPVERVNPKPGQAGHHMHEEWQAQYPTLASLNSFKVVRKIAPPEGFFGHIAYDADGDRLFLLSFGPPTVEGPSKLIELDPVSGNVLREAEMPFLGDFASPVFVDGYLYEGIYYESKMYKISVNENDGFGKIVKTIDLPTLNDLTLEDESHPVPYIEFGGVAATSDKNLIFHADDVGRFVVVERETGKKLDEFPTLKALGGIASVPAPDGKYYVLGNSDPRGAYCALSYPPSVSRSAEQKDISWALIEVNPNADAGADEPKSRVVASIRRQSSAAYASAISMVKHEPGTEEAPYGRFIFLATGEEGILTMEWTPGKNAF